MPGQHRSCLVAHLPLPCCTARVKTTASNSICVRHSGERVRAAIVNSGLVHPRGRLTVNLAPADLRKEGPAYDLPIAVGILLASEQVGADLSAAGLVGELSLDGQVRSVTGVLPMAVAARERGMTTST